MSKYQELCEAFHQSCNNWKEYQQQSYTFILKLAEGLSRHLECPANELYFYPYRELVDVEPLMSWGDMMYLDPEDFCWHCIINIKLHYLPGVQPFMQNAQLPVRFRLVKEGYFSLVLEDYEFEAILPAESDNSDGDKWQTFFEYVFITLQEEYRNSLKNFLDMDASAKRRIGFMPNS